MDGAAAPDNFRAITAEEIAQYKQNGWVKLQHFISPELAAELLARAKAEMGEDGDSNAPNGNWISYFNSGASGGVTDGLIGKLVRHAGASAKALMARKPGTGVRYYTDFFAPKLPAGKSSRHAGNGNTDFHQDFISWALDRSGGMTFWIALDDLQPESGTMSFVTGSHRMGTLGHYGTYGEGDLLETYPELREDCSITEPMSYAAGDCTVHSNLCVHGAGANRTDRPRWAYLIIVNPADARWNGAPPEAFSSEGLTIHEELDDARFPVIG